MASITEAIPTPIPIAQATISYLDDGYVAYYLTDTVETTNTTYRLTTNSSSYANEGDTKSINGTVTCDFDSSPFTLPRKVRGTGFVKLGTVGTGGTSLSFTVQVFKVDAASATTAISSVITSQSNTDKIRALFIAIPLTETVFKIGDSIRLEVKIINTGTGGALGHHPANADGRFMIIGTYAGRVTQSILFIPFDIT